MFETVNTIAIVGVLVVPMIAATGSLMDATRARVTESALATARDALIAFAAANDGCLPFAADFEGGLIDTNEEGFPATSVIEPLWLSDTGEGDRKGSALQKRFAGDLPWADLGLTNSSLAGGQLRVQYYVAIDYTCKIDPATGFC